MTLVTAGAGAALSGKLNSEVFVLGMVAIFAFRRMEATQSRWERVLGNRAAALEVELYRPYGAPGIVSTLKVARRASRQSRLSGWLPEDSSVFYGLL